MLLKDSTVNKTLTKLFGILENLQDRHKHDALIHLKSLQFCSVHKLEKLKQEKDSQIEALQNDLAQHLSQAKKQEEIKESTVINSKIDKMQDAIKQLCQKNNQYKSYLIKTAVGNLAKFLTAKVRKHEECFFKNLCDLNLQMMSISKARDKNSSLNRGSFKSEINQIQATPKTLNLDNVKNQTLTSRYINLSKEKIIDTILDQETKNYESIRSDLTKSNHGKDLDHETSKKYERRVNKFSITNKKIEAFMFETPSDQKHNYKSSFQAHNNLKLSPNIGIEENKFMILSDYAAPDREQCQKLSSTAAFKTIESSLKKPLFSESPCTDKAFKISEHAKTIKRGQRETNKFIKSKLSSIEPEENPHPTLLRKKTAHQMAVMDEGHSEPFEIIESIDFNKFYSKQKEKRKIDFDTPKLKDPIDTTEKCIQTASF